MPTSDPIQVLLAHDRWATSALLEACATLDREQFHRRFDMGPGSLHDTITHMLGAIRGWTDLVAGREQRPPLEQRERTPEELTALHKTFADDLEASAAKRKPDEILSGSRGGRTYSFTCGGVLVHVTTHGVHHRAQCVNMLRQLGVEPLPPNSVVEWMLTVDR